MNKNTNSENEYPDFSGVFDIDESEIPKEIIKKDPDTPRITSRFLTADNSTRNMSEKEQKMLKKEKKEKQKRIRRDKRRVRLIIILSTILGLLIIAAAARTGINEAKKPVIAADKPVEQTISRYSLANGISVTIDGIVYGVFIDNDYDVHYIEKGQTVEITDENGTVTKGRVALIREEAPDSALLSEYHALLFETKPSTSSYAVYVNPDNAEALKKSGLALSFRTITKTSENALTVSASSVYIDGNQHYVWTYSPLNKTLTKTPVRTGLTVDGITEITAGIRKSDKIMYSVSVPPESLYDGIKVKTE